MEKNTVCFSEENWSKGKKKILTPKKTLPEPLGRLLKNWISVESTQTAMKHEGMKSGPSGCDVCGSSILRTW